MNKYLIIFILLFSKNIFSEIPFDKENAKKEISTLNNTKSIGGFSNSLLRKSEKLHFDIFLKAIFDNDSSLGKDDKLFLTNLITSGTSRSFKYILGLLTDVLNTTEVKDFSAFNPIAEDIHDSRTIYSFVNILSFYSINKIKISEVPLPDVFTKGTSIYNVRMFHKIIFPEFNVQRNWQEYSSVSFDIIENQGANLDFYINYKVDMNAGINKPLYQTGNPTIIKKLLDAGADPNIPDREGNSLLYNTIKEYINYSNEAILVSFLPLKLELINIIIGSLEQSKKLSVACETKNTSEGLSVLELLEKEKVKLQPLQNIIDIISPKIESEKQNIEALKKQQKPSINTSFSPLSDQDTRLRSLEPYDGRDLTLRNTLNVEYIFLLLEVLSSYTKDELAQRNIGKRNALEVINDYSKNAEFLRGYMLEKSFSISYDFNRHMERKSYDDVLKTYYDRYISDYKGWPVEATNYSKAVDDYIKIKPDPSPSYTLGNKSVPNFHYEELVFMKLFLFPIVANNTISENQELINLFFKTYLELLLSKINDVKHIKFLREIASENDGNNVKTVIDEAIKGKIKRFEDLIAINESSGDMNNDGYHLLIEALKGESTLKNITLLEDKAFLKEAKIFIEKKDLLNINELELLVDRLLKVSYPSDQRNELVEALKAFINKLEDSSEKKSSTFDVINTTPPLVVEVPVKKIDKTIFDGLRKKLSEIMEQNQQILPEEMLSQKVNELLALDGDFFLVKAKVYLANEELSFNLLELTEIFEKLKPMTQKWNVDREILASFGTQLYELSKKLDQGVDKTLKSKEKVEPFKERRARFIREQTYEGLGNTILQDIEKMFEELKAREAKTKKI